MRLRNLVLLLVALTVMALAACSSSGQSSDEGGKDQAGKDASGEQAQKQKPPEKATDGKKNFDDVTRKLMRERKVSTAEFIEISEKVAGRKLKVLDTALLR